MTDRQTDRRANGYTEDKVLIQSPNDCYRSDMKLVCVTLDQSQSEKLVEVAEDQLELNGICIAPAQWAEGQLSYTWGVWRFGSIKG